MDTDFKIGDKVYRCFDAKPERIIWVGKKYLHLDSGIRIGINDLKIKFESYTYPYFRTQQETEEFIKKMDLVSIIFRKTYRRGILIKYTTDQLERIASILMERG